MVFLLPSLGHVIMVILEKPQTPQYKLQYAYLAQPPLPMSSINILIASP